MGTVLSAAQLAELGIGRRQRDAMMREGRLHRVEHGVFCTEPATGEQLLRALAVNRPHLVFSGPTARAIYDGTPVAPPLHGLVQRPHSHRSTELLTVRQVRTLPCRQVNGHRVVVPAAAVHDLLADDPRAARDFLERHYAGREGNGDLAFDLEQLGTIPRALRTALDASSIASDSKSERTLGRALKARGVTLVQNFPLGHYHWDYAIPAAKILIELDSFRFHAATADGANERTFIIDRWKANDGARRGWLVLRYTGECVYRHGDKVVEQIMDTITWRLNGGDPPEPLACEVAAPWTWHGTLRS
ncbi:DUF559 domain-containing protein [Corynebacterium sp.]|uniref:DUF559 domain-containing protein n=1 Tax=Corynebacterium sp. TaxID=1720 RepID=UPI0026E041FE|nr:DUF559 domain-containing protein [Corynebacterium sp.]MDO5512570.1 DUF559 domain-containing protein [Corynebacterium sp.]